MIETRTLAWFALLGVLLGGTASAAEPVELISDGGIDQGVGAWYSSGNIALQVLDGRLCADVPGGAGQYDVLIGQLGLPLVAGESYRLSFDASSVPGPTAIAAFVVDQTSSSIVYRALALAEAESHSELYFTPGASALAALFFAIGGSPTPWRFCVDDVSLLSGTRYAPETGPRVRVNQLGYLPHGPKRATLVTEATDALEYRVLDARGHVVLRGKSEPRGVDPTSGLNVHELRFDAVGHTGAGLVLVADGERSYPFDIAADLYRDLRTDSLALFYTQRSGLPIDGELAGPTYARAAGHLGVAPNLGDLEVPCQSPEQSQVVYGEPWTCDYALDVEGGWYDAGDQGKYVVNGGIAVAQLLSTYERALRRDSVGRGALGDGSLRIPERDNGVPDILDEARWELEWMLKMQVPAGKPLAGMVHHKVHDLDWTPLPMDPANDPNPRQLHRPSTAATLNLAAAAAQGARLYGRYDVTFAEQLLSAARVAWAAAVAHPALYATFADGQNGGGPFEDTDVDDEFYWAAAELYITTGEAEFREAVLNSKQHTADVFDVEGFSWQRVAALGRMDLAASGARLPDSGRVTRSVLDGASAILTLARAQPWGQPYAPLTGDWVWGSNSLILNNLVVLGTAYDLSGERRYRDAALEALDFLLGRNALNNSFVTGYGERFSQNQHSRMYATQLDPSLPHPPRGTLAGGPATALEDPIAQQWLAGCIGQFCYVDDIESFSTNELDINWNSALVWAASFAADQGSEDAACEPLHSPERLATVRPRSAPECAH